MTKYSSCYYCKSVCNIDLGSIEIEVDEKTHKRAVICKECAIQVGEVANEESSNNEVTNFADKSDKNLLEILKIRTSSVTGSQILRYDIQDNVYLEDEFIVLTSRSFSKYTKIIFSIPEIYPKSWKVTFKKGISSTTYYIKEQFFSDLLNEIKSRLELRYDSYKNSLESS